MLMTCLSMLMPGHVCRAAKYAARRAQEEADALKSEAKRLREKADDLLANLRAAEDDVSLCYSFPLHAPFCLVQFCIVCDTSSSVSGCMQVRCNCAFDPCAISYSV